MFFNDPIDKDHQRYWRTMTANLADDIAVSEVGYSEFPAKYSVKIIRDVDLYILHYVVKGKGIHNGHRFGQNCVYCVFPKGFEETSSDNKEPFHSYWIAIRGRGALRLLKTLGITKEKSVFVFDGVEQCAEILKKVLLDKPISNAFEEAALVEAALFEIVAAHIRYGKKSIQSDESVLKKATDLINGKYSTNVNISLIAKAVGISRSKLYGIFKQEYGLSPKEYLTNVRIEKAKELLILEETALTIQQVAYSTGFFDPMYFSRIFKRKTGLSPTEFRKLGVKAAGAKFI